MLRALPLATLGLATTAAAYQVALPTPITLDYVRDLPPQAADPYGRGATGDFDGDSLADVAFLHGDEIEAVFAPGLYMAAFDGIATANDVAVLPGGNANGADSLVSVDSGGLRERELVWNGDDPSWVLATLESSWAGASRVDSRELGGQTWIFGLQADGRTVRGRAHVPGSGWAEGALFTASFDAVELACLDSTGDGLLEVAVCGQYRWEIWRRNGSAFAPWVRLAHGSHGSFTLLDIAVGRQAGATREWVAFLASRNAAPTESYVIARDLMGTVGPIEIEGDPDAVGLAAGDLDEDGSDDLALSIRASHDVLVARNLGTGSLPEFDGARTTNDPPPALPPTVTIPIPDHSGPAGTNQAQPMAVDLDNDDDVDLCLPVQSSTMMFVHRDPLTGPPDNGGPGVQSNPSAGLIVEDEDGACSDSIVLLPTTTGTWPANTNLLESHLWIHEEGQQYTDPGTIDYRSSTQDPDPSHVYGMDLLLATNPGNDDPIGTYSDDSYYYFLVCYAEYDAGLDQVVRIARPQLYSFQTSCAHDAAGGCAAQAYLESFAAGATPYSLLGDDCLPGALPGIWSGGGVPQPCLPGLEPDTVPRLLRLPASN